MFSLYKYLPKGSSATVGRAILKTQRSSPTLLFVGGVVGVVATAALAGHATLRANEALKEINSDLEKAKELLQREDDRYTEDDFKKDLVILYSRKFVTVSKTYGPTILVGVVSIAMLTKSHRMLTSRNAALTAAYAALEKGFAEYRRRVVQEYGEDVDRKLRFSKDLEQKSSDNEFATKSHTPSDEYSIYARFFDQTSDKYENDAEYNLMYLRAKQNFANDLLRSRGHLFLNEVYDMLGLARSRAGQVVGWALTNDGDNYVDFGIFDHGRETSMAFVNGNEPSVLLDFNVDGVIYDKI